MDDEIGSIMDACMYNPKLRLVNQRWRDVFEDVCPPYRKRYNYTHIYDGKPMPKWIGRSIVELWMYPYDKPPFTLHRHLVPNDSWYGAIMDRSDICDVSVFAKIRSVRLLNCPNVTDVSSLRNVFNIELMGCDNIQDVSALVSVGNLSISHCNGITTDASELAAVPNLTIKYCRQIASVCRITALVL